MTLIIFILIKIGGFNTLKELNDLSKHANDFSTNNLLFVLPETEVI